jgi:putative component of toxin-antitoxin plasmid stabilization module
MYSIKRTDEFAGWLDGLKDRMTRVRLNRRLDRAQLGCLGGEKSTQTADIARAIKFASTMED